MILQFTVPILYVCHVCHVFQVGAVHVSGWRLNKCVGVTCLTVYAAYLAVAVSIECNVFGFVNPPMCKE